MSELVNHQCGSYQSLLSVSETLAAELSAFCDWVNEVKSTLSAIQLPVTGLCLQDVKDLLASHKVRYAIASIVWLPMKAVDVDVCMSNEIFTDGNGG